MKSILLLVITLFSAEAMAAVSCGVVSINQVLTGPRHGAMMLVSDQTCGYSGWVCLDPDAEHMSSNESQRLFSFVLSQKMANKNILLSVHENIYTAACNGPYPVVEDVRTYD